MTDMKEAIVFDSVSFSYEGMNKVLDGVSLTIEPGETVAVVGPNGAGKSTMMKLITGLIKPSEGTVAACGHQVIQKNLKAVRKKVGYIFQDSDNQLFMPSVYEDVAFGARQEGFEDSAVQDIVEKALSAVGAMHLKEKASYKMSGGEKRLVTLATAIATDPELLILDEPAVGLDPRARRELIRLLKRRPETKLITTHDMDMALELCDRIIVLYEGQIRADDKPMNIFRDKQLLCDNHLELPLRMQGCPVCQSEAGPV